MGGAANGSSYQFTGRENDGNSLYFYRARYYNPMYHRFIAQDPTDFNGMSANLYSFVMNNPVNFRDPGGLFACIAPPTGLGAIVGGIVGATLGGATIGSDIGWGFGFGIGTAIGAGIGGVLGGPGGAIVGAEIGG